MFALQHGEISTTYNSLLIYIPHNGKASKVKYLEIHFTQFRNYGNKVLENQRRATEAECTLE